VSFFDGGRSAGVVDLSALLDATFTELLRDLVGIGVLVSIGRSRDAGALSITVTSGGRWRREWLRTDEDVHDFLKEAITALGDEPPAAPTVLKPRRGR